MNLEEFSFVNQQLAGMLKSGIPLEGALKQLCATMRRGTLRGELEKLEADLTQGVPLAEALTRRKLPEFYVAMLRVGVQSNDLPGVLVLVADHYQRTHALWTRLKGLMVYPVMVLIGAVVLSAFISWWFSSMTREFGFIFSDMMPGVDLPVATRWALSMSQHRVPLWGWGILLLAILIALAVPAIRRKLRWKLPGFREGNLAQTAASLSMLLEKGCSLDESLKLLEQMESTPSARTDLTRWRTQLAEGGKKFSDLANGSKNFPPLFIWLVAGAGENLAGGFRRAAEVYHARAMHRAEMILNAALPISILVLGGIILIQIVPLAACALPLIVLME